MYEIRSMVRSPHTRAQRYASPIRDTAGTRHVLGEQLRLRKGRPLVISDEQLTQNLDELREKEKAGILGVFTRDGVRVDLQTLELGKGPVIQNPDPNFRLDSAAFDQPTGLPVDRFGDAPPKGPELGEVLDQMAGVEPEEPPPVESVPFLGEVTSTEPVEEPDVIEGMTEESAPEQPAAHTGRSNKKSNKRG